jgi:hypothetical protein
VRFKWPSVLCMLLVATSVDIFFSSSRSALIVAGFQLQSINCMVQPLFPECYNFLIVQVQVMAHRFTDLAQTHSSLLGSLGSDRVQGWDTM